MAIQQPTRRAIGIRIDEAAAQILNKAAIKDGRGLGNYISRLAEAHAKKIGEK